MSDELEALIDRARRASRAIYLAVDEVVADDISRILLGLVAALTPSVPVEQEDDPEPGEAAHELVEAFVDALTPMVANRTQAYNLWNDLASDTGAIRAGLEWAYRHYPAAPVEQEVTAEDPHIEDYLMELILGVRGIGVLQARKAAKLVLQHFRVTPRGQQ